MGEYCPAIDQSDSHIIIVDTIMLYISCVIMIFPVIM